MQLDLDFKEPISVSELTRRIKGTIEGAFPDVWIVGEITNLRIPSSGHLYFTLKDEDAQIRAVFFRMGARFLKFRPKDGLEVIVRGRVSVYEQRGEYQVIVEYMEPKGLGALQLAFLQLKEKLESEGLFDTARKRHLPEYPKHIGVVTSPTGAAIRDILKVLRRRAPGVSVTVAPAAVQGDAAPAEIAAAIADLNEYGGLDVIIAGRGGGSLEDLAAFNSEVVARAIYGSETPVISAVGHETDVTIADFVADLRAPTPSAAAEIVAKSEESIREALSGLHAKLAREMRQTLRLVRAGLDSETRALSDPMSIIQDRMLRTDDLCSRLKSGQRRSHAASSERVRSAARSIFYLSPERLIRAGSEALENAARGLVLSAGRNIRDERARLKNAAGRLSALEPLGPLSRGFALARKLPGMEVVTSAGQVEIGGRIDVELKDGGLTCRVEDKRAGKA